MQLQINYNSEMPIYLQIRNQIVIGISDQELVAGEQLPTTRALASALGINTMTVNKAYQQLKQEGYILTDRRRGAVVAERMVVGGLDQPWKERLQILISEAEVKKVPLEKILELCKEYYCSGHKEAE